MIWLSLEELGQQPELDPLLVLLTLPVRPEAQLKISTPRILERRPDLLSTVLTILIQRFPTFTLEEIMVIAGIPTDQLLHTRAAQIQALPLEQLEALAEALLDFSGPADLTAWLAEHAG